MSTDTTVLTNTRTSPADTAGLGHRLDQAVPSTARLRWLAASIVVLSFLCMVTTKTLLFPAVTTLLTLAALRLRSAPDLGSPTSAALLITVGFSLKFYIAPFEPVGLRTLLAFSLVHAVGQGLMVWQIVALWSRREKWLEYVPLCGILTAMCWGDIELGVHERKWYSVGIVALFFCDACAIGSAVRTRSARPRHGSYSRAVALATVLLAFGACLWITAPIASRVWRQLEDFLNRHLADQHRTHVVGFSTQSHLGTVEFSKGWRSEWPVLRVESDEPPGYLRGAAFERFDGTSWRTELRWTMVPSTIPKPSSTRAWDPTAEDGYFEFATTPPDDATFVPVIWPEGTSTDRLFLPLEADALISSQDRLQRDSAGIVAVVPGNDASLPYRVHRGSHVAPQPTPETHRELFRVSDRYKENLRMLADDFCWTGDTPEETVDRLRRFFHENFQYTTVVDIPIRSDPLERFLLKTRQGHCEYFATATTILLRMQGIAARYVTGYLVDEFNPQAGYWIARHKDAHAWCEAYLPGRGWVVVDCTPVDTSASAPETSWWIGQWDAMQWLLRKARWEAIRDGWAGIRYWMRAFFFTVPGLAFSISFLTWFLFRVLWPTSQTLMNARRRTAGDRLSLLLGRFDSRLQSLQLERAPSETLTRFADRIRAAGEATSQHHLLATWLDHFVDARYSAAPVPAVTGETNTDTHDERIRSLETELTQLMTPDIRASRAS